MTHRIMPRVLTLFRDLTVLEEALEKFVCVRIGPAGIFRDGHCVAFHWKVTGGQGYVGVSARRVPLENSLSVLPLFREQIKSL